MWSRLGAACGSRSWAVCFHMLVIRCSCSNSRCCLSKFIIWIGLSHGCRLCPDRSTCLCSPSWLIHGLYTSHAGVIWLHTAVGWLLNLTGYCTRNPIATLTLLLHDHFLQLVYNRVLENALHQTTNSMLAVYVLNFVLWCCRACRKAI